MRRVARTGILVGNAVRHERRFAVAATGVRTISPRAARRSHRARRRNATSGRPIVVVLNVVLAAPHHLAPASATSPWRRARRGRCNRGSRAGGDRNRRRARSWCNVTFSALMPSAFAARAARVQRILRARPDLGAIAFDRRRAHHRLHRRVAEKRHLVVGGDDLRGAVRHRRRRARATYRTRRRWKPSIRRRDRHPCTAASTPPAPCARASNCRRRPRRLRRV